MSKVSFKVFLATTLGQEVLRGCYYISVADALANINGDISQSFHLMTSNETNGTAPYNE
ncbi:MAG: hypothetical protein HKL80_05910 [Acidimicrobiales bacterium]|nr:hypothetical protein [Acidimicrobiales bacterium]